MLSQYLFVVLVEQKDVWDHSRITCEEADREILGDYLETVSYTHLRRMFPKKTEEEIYSTNPGIMGGNVVELEQDMLTVKSFPKRMIPCEMDASGSGFENHAFFEASSIRKIGDTYYFCLLYTSRCV